MNTTSISADTVLKRHVALPQDHGSWVFLLSPLLIGLFAGGNWGLATLALIIAAMAAFLIRQPMTIATKVISGRRSRRELPAALFWIAIYALIGSLALVWLILLGHAEVLWLAVPGVPVFAWHLYLVSKRSERRQLFVELIATGVLALAAPAGYWVGLGQPSPTGWLLWLLVWAQSAASIIYAYLRLEQRSLKTVPPRAVQFSMARTAIVFAAANMLAVVILGLEDIVSFWLAVPYLLQLAETIWGSFNPAVGYRPTAIGIRQLVVSSLFTILFILTWTAGLYP